MLVSNVSPRHLSPNSVYHVNANSKLVCHFFSSCAFLNFFADLTHFIRRKFFSFFQNSAAMPSVFAGGNILKIAGGVITFIAVFMVNVMAFWARTYKGFSNHTVNGFMKMPPVYRQSDKIIPIVPNCRFKNNNSVFIRNSTQYFTDYRLANTKHRGYFSCAYAFRRQPAHFFNVRVVKPTLRQIWRPQTKHLTGVAYLVRLFKPYYTAPRLHLQTPVS
jgi:hypothetical protein